MSVIDEVRGDQGEGPGKRGEEPWGERREEGKVLKKDV